MRGSTTKNLLFSVLTVAFLLGCLEGGARFFGAGRETSVYEEHQRIIDVLGLRDLNETMTFDRHLFWRLKPHLKDRRVHGAVRGELIDFRVSTNDFGLRDAEIGPKRGLRILALGNSCTFGVGVEGEDSFPEQLENLIGQSVPEGIEVLNAGTPGYTAFQGRRFLERIGDDLDPDIVIVSFGFNDSDVWSSRTDRETAAVFEPQGWRKWARRSAFYRLLAAALPRKGADTGAGGAAAGGHGESGVGQIPRLMPEEFYEEMTAIAAWANDRGRNALFLVWPYRKQVTENRPEPIIYQPLILKVAADTRSPAINLIDAMIAAGEQMESAEALFVDHIHGSPAGCRVVATAVADLLARARTR